jgi:hypothetical protein
MSDARFDRTDDLLAARDRHRHAAAAALSPAERLDAMRRLLARSRAMLLANPAGANAFLRRNYKARAVTFDEGRYGDGS